MEDSSLETMDLRVKDAGLLPTLSERQKDEDVSQAEDKGSVFEKLVTSDTDVVGLVAYSIYKQNKLDWLRAFERIRGCPPGEAERLAYAIGENTQRRIATYRHLAESTLAGTAIGPNPTGARPKPLPFFEPASEAAKTMTVSYLILAVVLLIAIFLAAHFGFGK